MKMKRLFATALALSLMAGGLVAIANHKANDVVQAKADSEPNSTYSHIYSDAFNNAAVNASFSQVMFVYSGEPHGQGTLVVSGEDLHAFDDKLLLNGNSISSYAGSQVVSWEGQPWIRVLYPVSAVSEGSVLEIRTGFTFGAAILNEFSLKLASDLKWKQYFTDPVNATYASIYSGYNNSQHAEGYNRLMFTYTGTAHGVTAAIANAELLKNYDLYVQIDGTPLSAYAGGSTQIAPWGGQLWIQLIYPATAVSVGSRLVINEGFKIGAAVFGKIVFQLNSSSEWEKLTLVEDDPLVKNSDYLLFTPSDYNLPGNDTNPFYGSIGGICQNSFCFQFKANIPTANLATTIIHIYLGATNIYGSNPVIDIRLNDATYRYGMFFNGTYDWTSYGSSPNWTGDVEHVVEYYGIRTDSTHMTFLMAFDDNLIWKTSAIDTSAVDYTDHTYMCFQNSGSTKDASYYSSTSTIDKALGRFAKNKLHSEDVSFSDNSETTNCLSYYDEAKTYYNTYLNPAQKKAFAADAEYAQLRARMIAWAAANGESISFNVSTGELVLSANNRFAIINNNNGAITITLIIVVSSLCLLATLFFLKNRKKEDK